MLNSRGESDHLYLVPDLRGKAFSLSLLSMMLVVGSFFFINALYHVEKMPINSTFLNFFFNMKGCFVLPNDFSASVEKIIRF